MVHLLSRHQGRQWAPTFIAITPYPLPPFMHEPQHSLNLNHAQCSPLMLEPQPHLHLNIVHCPPLMHEPQQPLNFNHAHSSHLCHILNTHWCTVTAGTSTTYIKEAADVQAHPTPINVAKLQGEHTAPLHVRAPTPSEHKPCHTDPLHVRDPTPSEHK